VLPSRGSSRRKAILLDDVSETHPFNLPSALASSRMQEIKRHIFTFLHKVIKKGQNVSLLQASHEGRMITRNQTSIQTFIISFFSLFPSLDFCSLNPYSVSLIGNIIISFPKKWPVYEVVEYLYMETIVSFFFPTFFFIFFPFYPF
jgi:hypothetical protein